MRTRAHLALALLATPALAESDCAKNTDYGSIGEHQCVVFLPDVKPGPWCDANNKCSYTALWISTTGLCTKFTKVRLTNLLTRRTVPVGFSDNEIYTKVGDYSMHDAPLLLEWTREPADCATP